MSIKANPKSAFSCQNRGISREALGDLDGALADLNQAIRLDPTLPLPLINRTAIWRVEAITIARLPTAAKRSDSPRKSRPPTS